MPIDTQMPEWIVRKHWTESDSVSRDLQAGMQFGQNQKRLAIMATQAAVEDRFRAVQTDAMLLRNAEQAAELEDARRMMVAQRAYIGGQKDVEPELFSFKGRETWQRWRAVHDAESADAAEWTGFLKDYAALDGYGKAAVRQIGEWPVRRGGILPEHYQILGNEQKRMQTESFALKNTYRTIEVDGEKFLQSSTGGIRSVPKNFVNESGEVKAVEILDDDGNVIGHALPSRNGLQLLRPPTAKRHPLQNKLDGLRAEAAGLEKATLMSEKRKLPAVVEQIKTLERIISEDQPALSPVAQPTSPAATNTPLNVLRYDSATGTFR